MVKLNMEDPWIAMYQGMDEVEQAVHRYHQMEEEEQQDPQERQQLASIFGADYKLESGGSSSNYHREPPKDGRPYSTLCNVCPTYVYDDEEKEPKIKKEDNRDWHEEPPKNGEPYTVLETDPPLYEYKEIANPVGGGGEPVQQTLDVPLLVVSKKRKQTVAARKRRNSSKKQVKKKAKKEKEVEVDQPDAVLQQQQQQIPVVEQAPSVTVQNESQPLQQQQQPYSVPVSYYYPPWQPPFPISYWQPVAYCPSIPPYYTTAAAELPSQGR